MGNSFPLHYLSRSVLLENSLAHKRIASVLRGLSCGAVFERVDAEGGLERKGGRASASRTDCSGAGRRWKGKGRGVVPTRYLKTRRTEMRRVTQRRRSVWLKVKPREVHPRVAEERGTKKIRKRSLMSDWHQEMMSRSSRATGRVTNDTLFTLSRSRERASREIALGADKEIKSAHKDR